MPRCTPKIPLVARTRLTVRELAVHAGLEEDERAADAVGCWDKRRLA